MASTATRGNPSYDDPGKFPVVITDKGYIPHVQLSVTCPSPNSRVAPAPDAWSMMILYTLNGGGGGGGRKGGGGGVGTE